MRIPQIVDTWLGQPLTPGGNDSSSSFDVSVRGPDGLMPDQLVGTVAYAEFSDGTRFGPDVSTMSAYLSKARSEALEVYSKILDTYNAKGEQAVSRVLSQPMAWPANQNEKWAWVHLRERYKQQGVGSVIAEIKNRLAK